MAKKEDTVQLRKDFIHCWVHANPECSAADASALYDRLEKEFPEMTRGGHRGLVGRQKPWETVEHECPHCGHVVHGVKAIKEAFGLRRQNGHVYTQSWCSPCRAAKRKGKLHTRINPTTVREVFTNGPEAGQAPRRVVNGLS